jgi:hypothetical protein
MPRHRRLQIALAALTSFLCLSWLLPAQQRPPQSSDMKFPCPEKLSYRVEWHGITAGLATVTMVRPNPEQWQTTLDIESAGMVSRLYHVLDKYKSVTAAKFCGTTAELDAQEGKRHNYTKLNFDPARQKVNYFQHDLIKNQEIRKELDAPPCTYEITGALEALRAMSLEPGKTITVPLTDGKKFANARIDAQARENITVGGKSYPTIRYEAFVFDNVIYKRKGRLEVWITDDAGRLPVQFRMQAGFPVGTVNVELEKQEKG